MEKCKNGRRFNDVVLPIKQLPEKDLSKPLHCMNTIQEITHPEISIVQSILVFYLQCR